MSWLLAIIKAIPALINAFRELIWRWETEKGLRNDKEDTKTNDEIHDEIKNGGRPKWDDRS